MKKHTASHLRRARRAPEQLSLGKGLPDRPPATRPLSARCILGAMVCISLLGCGDAVKPGPRVTVFYPPLPERPRIQFLRTLSSSEDIEPPRRSGFAAFLLGEEDPEEKKVRMVVRAYGVALWEDKLYVCDPGGGKVVIFDFKQKKFRTFGHKEDEDRPRRPINISIGPNGQKYITDTGVGWVYVYDRNDRLVRTIKGPDSTIKGPDNTIKGPVRMKACDAVANKGELFVGCLANHCIFVFDPTSGRLVRQFGRGGPGPAQLAWPTNIAFGPRGRLFVCDTLAARVQVFDRQGKFVQQIGSLGLAIGKMIRPKGIAVDRAGRLYVADAATDSVQIYNSEGRLLLMLGKSGKGPGDMILPTKVVISYDGIELFSKNAAPKFKVEYLIFVTNQMGPNKINVYGFGNYQGVVPDEVERAKASTQPATAPASAPATAPAARKASKED